MGYSDDAPHRASPPACTEGMIQTVRISTGFPGQLAHETFTYLQPSYLRYA